RRLAPLRMPRLWHLVTACVVAVGCGRDTPPRAPSDAPTAAAAPAPSAVVAPSAVPAPGPAPKSGGDAPAGPRIAVDPTEHDFGTTKQNVRLSTQFEVRNVGTATLHIKKIEG